uniref:SH3-domain GRB2-like endophilin B1b n=1 Tax=Paramormyrops kingsleyae TaxID=1676925 RepID=A0A3B3R8I4_9TELE
MDFSVKRLASDAGTFLSRAVQFAEEKLGQAEKTELDVRLDNLLTKADTRRRWTERLIKQTEVVLQPNPGLRMEGLLYEMLEREAPRHTSNHEQLGECMIDAGHELGPGTAYGKVLIKCGEMEKQIGGTQRKLIQGVTVGFLTPLRNFIEWDSKTVLKEGRLLENRRLDLDAAKTRLKRAQIADAHHAVVYPSLHPVSISCSGSEHAQFDGRRRRTISIGRQKSPDSCWKASVAPK